MSCETETTVSYTHLKRFEFELKRALKKQEMGVRFFLTQPIYSEDAIENLKMAKQKLDAKILAGFMPIVSHRNAVFLNNEAVSYTHLAFSLPPK